jgi:membrane-associated phospholipid phosphatase
LVVVFLYTQNALNVDGYVNIQKDLFYFLNTKLSPFPKIQCNITQFGDAHIGMSFLTILIIYAPKIWESLLTGSLVSLVLSGFFKNLFKMPRPAAILDHANFTIIGKTLNGCSSLPSGHSITTFTIITIIMFGFMPKNLIQKIEWCISLLILGLIIIVTRVAVGAHFPIDVLVGSILGFLSGLLGILINQKYTIWMWINQKKYYPFFILLFVSCIIVLISKIRLENLLIYYLSIISLSFSLYKVIKIYAKK